MLLAPLLIHLALTLRFILSCSINYIYQQLKQTLLSGRRNGGSGGTRSVPRLTRNQVRPVTNDDIGLKVLREAPAEAEQSIEYVHQQYLPAQTHTHPSSIVAIHGLGAHPDDSWCANAGTKESPQWVNWLEEERMLPAVAPNARIMRYGYQSQWFGQEMMQQSVSSVADRLLINLKRRRKVRLVGSKC
jgi:hypothetical protein